MSARAVSATAAAMTAKVIVPPTTPISQAPERAARMPERAENSSVNTRNARGVSERVKFAASGAMPTAATTASGSATSMGTP